jgi:hypothetical protein
VATSPPLEVHAGIRAALAEGHELEAVLAQEGVPAWRWPAIDIAVSDSVTRDAELFQAYAAKLSEAEDVLERRVQPLDHDLGAWIGFVAALGAEGDRLLDRHGLRATDVARLQRSWQRRFDGDAVLARRAAKLAAAPPAPPHALRVEPSRLRPFPWSPRAEQARIGVSLEPHAHLQATAAAPLQRPVHRLPFEGARPAPGTFAIEPSPELGRTAPLTHPREPRAATPFEPSPPPAAEPRASPEPASPRVIVIPDVLPRRRLELEPALAVTAPSMPTASPALPFSRVAGARSPLPAPLEPVAGMGQTAPVGPAPRRAALPFAAPSRGVPCSAAGGTPQPRGPAVPVWTAEDYGRFCAELDAADGDRARVLARWGIAGESARAEIERAWRDRFQADPALRDRFVAALRAARPG